MLDILLWLIRKIGIRLFFTLVLITIAFGMFAFALAQIVRGFEWNLALTITLLGLSVGWGLARLPLPGVVAGIVAAIIGGEVTVIRVGQLGGKLFALARASFESLWRIVTWQFDAVNARAILDALIELVNALVTIFTRAREWWSAIVNGVPAFDPVAVALTWSWIVWGCSVWAAWSLARRHKSFDAFLPSIALLATMLAYTNADSAYLAWLLAAMLMLMPLATLRAHEQRWQSARRDVADMIAPDVAIVTIPLVVGLVVLAYATPSLSVRQIVRAVQERLEAPAQDVPRWGDSLGLIPHPAPTQTIFDVVRAPGLPRRHLLGAGQELSERLALVVTTNDIVSDEDVPPRYYWRASTYDRYTGRGWTTSATDIVDYSAGESVGEAYRAQRLVTQVVEWLGAPGLIYATGALVTANHDFRVAWHSPEDAFSASIRATTYRVESRVSFVGEKELRASGANYPAWVRERYLVLPDGIPERVLTFARDLTATAPTPYDRARALERYLRQFPYTLDVPAPPPNRDVVDYFLFDLQRGYCDYYATAFVVLARAAGLPARLVVGYASGTYDYARGQFIVTEADAHAWGEVYFPTYGWIEFEPTANRAPLTRPDETPLVEESNVPLNSRAETSDRWRVFDARSWLWLPLGVLGGTLALCVADGLRLRLLDPARAVAILFGRLVWMARVLGVSVHASHTPNEIGALLCARLAALARKHNARVWRDATARVTMLTALYVHALYGRRVITAREHADALRAWYALVWQVGWVHLTVRRLMN
jgi:transglutaminase-like putative cysteine protease